jgi:hypothetical protein
MTRGVISSPVLAADSLADSLAESLAGPLAGQALLAFSLRM